MTENTEAPGRPGIPPRWTSSAKTGVGTALSAASRVSFTVSHGILNEIYFPRADEACTRDCGLIVTDGAGYLSEEKRDTQSTLEMIGDGVPGYRLINRSDDGRYTIEKRIVTDSARDVVLQRIRFMAQDRASLRVFALLAPHLVNAGAHNTAWVDTLKGWRMAFATGRGVTLALAASRPFRAMSVGFVGVSDGYSVLETSGWLARTYDRAEDGNVAICAELDFSTDDELVLALGFGRDMHDSGNKARASVMEGFDIAERSYVEGWRAWQDALIPLDDAAAEPGREWADGRSHPYRVSMAVLRTHEAAPAGGGMIASLSIPWGASKGDDDLGGYHLVWPRDLVESATALLAAGANGEVRRVLTFLQATQEPDGHWPQNMWLDGRPYWPGLQMDECAFPILLVDAAFWEGAIGHDDLRRYWPMVRHAARFILLNGPVTGQDRWEEDGGYSPFTLAVEIAGLVVAADIAERLDQTEEAAFLLETADLWNASIERWCFATDTALSRRLGIEGYYVRIAPTERSDAASPLSGFVAIKNRPASADTLEAAAIVSPDALALVRFGLRAPDDPRIVSTVRAIDHLLKVELPQGPLWYRYNDDGYGEHEDGAPFDGTGVGRAWPLLAGERAHYELALGNRGEARRLLAALEGSANEGGFIPEQVWDANDIPARELVRGRPSGSAMPLVWAHSEHVKLLRSLRDGAVFDTPPQVKRRYAERGTGSRFAAWRFNNLATTLALGKVLRIEVMAPAIVHWTGNKWADTHDLPTRKTQFDLHVADLDTAGLPLGAVVIFTLFWPEAGNWEGRDFAIRVVAPDSECPVDAHRAKAA